ncbi:hypothetical protein LY78DRAFT_346077 [Colletotrichum sublineola]|nr:hypothetical protein LY78DRAFT_346077 [Colletotrichum sublineola]
MEETASNRVMGLGRDETGSAKGEAGCDWWHSCGRDGRRCAKTGNLTGERRREMRQVGAGSGEGGSGGAGLENVAIAKNESCNCNGGGANGIEREMKRRGRGEGRGEERVVEVGDENEFGGMATCAASTRAEQSRAEQSRAEQEQEQEPNTTTTN